MTFKVEPLGRRCKCTKVYDMIDIPRTPRCFLRNFCCGAPIRRAIRDKIKNIEAEENAKFLSNLKVWQEKEGGFLFTKSFLRCNEAGCNGRATSVLRGGELSEKRKKCDDHVV